jgi:hypothetical protein
MMDKRLHTSLLLAICTAWSVAAQGSLLPPDDEAYTLLERLEVRSGRAAPFHSPLKGITRQDAVAYALRLDTVAGLPWQLRTDMERLFLGSNEWLSAAAVPPAWRDRRGYFEPVPGDTLFRRIEGSPLADCVRHPYYTRRDKPWLGHFYPTPANLLEVNQPAFHLRVNPLLYLQAGLPSDDPEAVPLFHNSRGLELRGGFDDRVFFYTQLSDNQARFPGYVRDYLGRTKSLPYVGYYKRYDAPLPGTAASQDWLNAQAHIGFRVTPHIGLQFGHGRHFIGSGYRSLLLSDFSNNNLFLRINWRAGRLHYQNLFLQVAATSALANPGDSNLPRKYVAAHVLHLQVTDHLQVGLFEATVFRRSVAGGSRFELQYLNPVILYRSVEHLVDSEDNVLVGGNLQWDLFRRLRLYGQFLLDEYKASELFSGSGWWANKWGIQGGLLYVDAFGIDHLDLRAEFNTVRPYTYTHRDSLGAGYSAYRLPLAHPLGANFKEWLGTARYQPHPRWVFEARYLHIRKGEDAPGENWGGDILLDYRTPVREYGNRTGQGLAATTRLLTAEARYAWCHQGWVFMQGLYRTKRATAPASDQRDAYLSLGLRLNMAPMRMDF